MPETDWANVTVESITAGSEHDDGRVEIGVEFGNVYFGGGRDRLPLPTLRDQWVTNCFTLRFIRALGVRGVSSGGSRIGVSVERDRLEESVGTVGSFVAEWNESYPALLVEYVSYAEAKRVEKVAEQKRRKEDQALIDRAMGAL